MTNPSDGSVELWATDGTIAGSQLLKTLYPGISTYIDGYSFYVFNDKLFFVASNNIDPMYDIWGSDGTVGGTAVVTDLNGSKYDVHPDITGGVSNKVTFRMFIAAEGEFLLGFGVTGTNSITHLWKTDGTEIGTVFIKDIYGE